MGARPGRSAWGGRKVSEELDTLTWECVNRLRYERNEARRLLIDLWRHSGAFYRDVPLGISREVIAYLSREGRVYPSAGDEK